MTVGTEATESAIDKADEKNLFVDTPVTNGGAKDDTVELSSSDEYSVALARTVRILFARDKDIVYGAGLIQRSIHVMTVIGLYIGNRMGYNAAKMGKTRNAIGLTV